MERKSGAKREAQERPVPPPREAFPPERPATETAPPPPARRALRAAIALSLAVACAAPLLGFALFFPFVDNIPKWDQWSMIEVWEAHFQGRPVLPLLLKPYNGHLNVLPRIVFYLLGSITHWDLRIEVLISYGLALATAAALLCMLRDSGEELLLLAAPASALVFSLIQFENYLSGYPMGQVLSQCATTWTILLLTRPRIMGRHVAAAAVAAVVATFSWGAGLVAWPLGLAAVALRPESRRRMLIPWSVLTLACALLVRQGAGPVGGQGLGQTLKEFDAPFFLAMLGRPASSLAFPGFTAAAGLGLLLVLAFALLLQGALRSRRWLPALRWGLLGASSLGAVGLITLARFRSGPEQALISHYSTAAYPLLLAVLALAGHALLAWQGAAASRLQRSAAVLLVLALLVLPLVLVEVQSREAFLTLRNWEGASRVHDQKFLAGTITDDEIRSSIHPDTALVRHGTLLLRQHRMAVFGHPPD